MAINAPVLILVGVLVPSPMVGIPLIAGVIIGAILMAIFFKTLIVTHRYEEIVSKPEEVNKLITSGIYSRVRHPFYLGAILMNLAFFFFFRNLWIIAPIAFFTLWWYWEAKQEERILLGKFGSEYEEYKKRAGMFWPKLRKGSIRH